MLYTVRFRKKSNPDGEVIEEYQTKAHDALQALSQVHREWPFSFGELTWHSITNEKMGITVTLKDIREGIIECLTQI